MGFWSVDVPPSPKVQIQLVGDPVELSINVTFNGDAPVDGVPVKKACGLEE